MQKKKLVELKELSRLAECGNIEEDERFKTNRQLFAGTRKCDNEAVKKRLEEVTEADYRRLPARSERHRLQKKEFALPKLPTTTIGSFHRQKMLKVPTVQHSVRVKSAKNSMLNLIRRKLKNVSDGRKKSDLMYLFMENTERNDMVEYFGEALGGFLFTEKAWVQSYGTRCVKPPVIWGRCLPQEADNS